MSATALCTWLKPDHYFNTTWRRTKGGGPVLINLIHDIDLLRHLFGDLESLQAVTSNQTRGFEVEDTAAVVLKFRNGALATVSVSDTVAAPWNYDLAAGEVERFPRRDVNSHYLCGTDASLSSPDSSEDQTLLGRSRFVTGGQSEAPSDCIAVARDGFMDEWKASNSGAYLWRAHPVRSNWTA